MTNFRYGHALAWSGLPAVLDGGLTDDQRELAAHPSAAGELRAMVALATHRSPWTIDDAAALEAARGRYDTIHVVGPAYAKPTAPVYWWNPAPPAPPLAPAVPHTSARPVPVPGSISAVRGVDRLGRPALAFRPEPDDPLFSPWHRPTLGLVPIQPDPFAPTARWFDPAALPPLRRVRVTYRRRSGSPAVRRDIAGTVARAALRDGPELTGTVHSVNGWAARSRRIIRQTITDRAEHRLRRDVADDHRRWWSGSDAPLTVRAVSGRLVAADGRTADALAAVAELAAAEAFNRLGERIDYAPLVRVVLIDPDVAPHELMIRATDVQRWRNRGRERALAYAERLAAGMARTMSTSPVRNERTVDADARIRATVARMRAAVARRT